jgi:uncharacterized protein YcfJ
MNSAMRNALGVIAAAISAQAAADIVLYEREGFRGQSFTAQESIRNLERFDFNNRASSAVVLGGRWEACEERRFEGRCVILRPGRYASLGAMGLNNNISSLRPISSGARVGENRYAPDPVPVYDNRRRQNERLYEANVVAVRAVVGPPEQRCWVEREQIPQAQTDINVPGAVVGAVIGGVLGHQVGSGRGNTAATVAGTVAGGAVGANVNRYGSQPPQTRDVQKCASVPSQTPAYYDVTYDFRGQEHHMQTTTPPGRTVTVNERGEPRVG